jgi:hypothetical protein
MNRFYALLFYILSCSSPSTDIKPEVESCDPISISNDVTTEECLPVYVGSTFGSDIKCEGDSYLVNESTSKYEYIYCQKNISNICYKDGQYNSFSKKHNNEIKVKSSYVKGKQIGYFVSFNKNGQKLCEGTAKDEYWNGAVSCWYADGKPMTTGNYLNGHADGHHTYIDKAGTKHAITRHPPFPFNFRRRIE